MALNYDNDTFMPIVESIAFHILALRYVTFFVPVAIFYTFLLMVSRIQQWCTPPDKSEYSGIEVLTPPKV